MFRADRERTGTAGGCPRCLNRAAASLHPAASCVLGKAALPCGLVALFLRPTCVFLLPISGAALRAWRRSGTTAGIAAAHGLRSLLMVWLFGHAYGMETAAHPLVFQDGNLRGTSAMMLPLCRTRARQRKSSAMAQVASAQGLSAFLL